MQPAKPRPDEAGSLQALADLQVLDSAGEPEFDALVRAASLLCGVPIALISLIDSERQWFKAQTGLPGLTQTPREQAFCAHAVLGNTLLEVPDASQDPRFHDNPLVIGQPGIRFYAGAPLQLRSGHRVGTLCLIDRQPRLLSDIQREALQCLAVAASSALEGRQARLAAQQAMADLAASEARFRALSDGSPLGVYQTDTSGACVYTNRQWQLLHGLSEAQGMGAGWAHAVHPQDRAAVLAACQGSALAQVDFDMAFRIQRPDGSTRFVHARARPILDRQQTLVGHVGSVEDVTEQRATWARLVASEQRLRSLYQTTPAMLHAVDLEGHLTMVSDAWLARLGYTRDEVLGHPAIAFLSEASRELALQHALPGLTRLGQQDELALQMVSRSGEVIDVLQSAVVELDATGQPSRIMAGLQDVTLRGRAERALQTEQQRLRNIIEGTHAGVWEWNVQTNELRLNERSAALLGQTPAGLGDQTIALRAQCTHPDDWPVVAQQMQRHLSGQSAYYEVESRVRSGDGSWVWMLDRGRLMTRSADGQPEWVFGIHQDINDRKQLERRLIDRERFLRLLVDSVPGLIAHIGTDRRYTLVNRAYTEWSQRPESQIVGRLVAEAHGEPGHAVLAPYLQRAFNGESVSFEVNLQRGDELRAMQVTYVPERDASDRVSGVFSMKVDVTPLRRAEEHLRLVMEMSPQGMFTTDLTGLCTYTNAAWQRVTGLTLAQSLGTGLRNILHPDDAQGVLAQRRAALDQGGVHTSEHRYQRADGSVVWVRGHLTLLRRHGSPESYVGTVEDITERRRLDQALAAKRAELTRSNQELERFAYVASHDLQEPLRMVTSYGQLLTRRHQAELSAEVQEFLHYMVDGGLRAQALVRDLLSLARIDNAAQPHQAVALDAVLAVTLQQLRLQVQETGACISHDPLPTVLADPVQIGQLLSNLLGNALKFRSPAPPAVHLSAEREATAWRISVRDNGIGFDPRYAERVFVMFQRLHLRSEHGGTGIGLAICKKVVENHGGRIGVRSVPGQGSTFYFTLPDSRSAASDAAPTGPALPGA